MVTKFVNSGAGGTNDGSSWANAWTSITSATGVAAGDTVKVHKTSSNTGLSANLNFSNGTIANPVLVVCCDKDASDALATGALIDFSTSGVGFQGCVSVYGCTIRCSSAAAYTNTPGVDKLQEFDTCIFSSTGSGATMQYNASANAIVRFYNCNADFSGSSSASVRIGATGQLEWNGGTITCRSTQTSLFSTNVLAYLRAVTVSGTLTNIALGTGSESTQVILRGCVLPTYTNIWGTTPSGSWAYVSIEDCAASGTLTAAVLAPNVFCNRFGTVKALTTPYRTGGASDGSNANPYSWEFAANANANSFSGRLFGPTITRWVGAGSQTLTFYVASGGTLNDNDFGADVFSPSEAGSPTALQAIQKTRTAYLGSVAALTTDSGSTWNGSGVGTMQKFTVTIAPTIAGRVVIRPWIAKASTTAYLDPLVSVAGDVNGKSRFFDGAQTFEPTTYGGVFSPFPGG